MLGGQLRTMAVNHPVEVSVCVCFNVYSFLRDRERQTTSGGGSQREGDIEPEAGSRLLAVSTESNAGLEPMIHEIMT